MAAELYWQSLGSVDAWRGSVTPAHDPYGALRYRDFRLLLIGSFVSNFGGQMLGVALGWELYDRTGSALVLGGIGLAQVLPVIVLILPAGYVADHYNRKRVVVVTQVALAVGSLALALLSYRHGALPLIYGCLAMMGTAQAFSGPAGSALLAQVIPGEAYENAMTWRSSTGQLSSVLGPAVGGFLIALLHGALWVYVLDGLAGLVFATLLLLLRASGQQSGRAAGRAVSVTALAEGVRFLGRTPVLLAAITLDLFAVLLGGATTLLPVFARSILHVGPVGLGWLQAASAAGAVCMALTLAHRPPFAHAGRTLLVAVAGFGVVTIVFGLSSWFPLSLLMLFLLGALDNISVVVRSTLVLLRTPDELRGRVGAVNSLFISASNQLGGFESGLTAQLFGPVAAVAAGGVGTLLVVALVAWKWPEMRRLGALSQPDEASPDVRAGG